MNDQDKLLDQLKSLPLFDSLDDKSLKNVSKNFEVIDFQMGETILLDDKVPDSFYFVLEGEVRQLVVNPISNKTLFTLATYKKGYLIGWYSYLVEKPIEFITSATDCKLLKISIRNFINFKKKNPTIFEDFFQQISPCLTWFLLMKQKI